MDRDPEPLECRNCGMMIEDRGPMPWVKRCGFCHEIYKLLVYPQNKDLPAPDDGEAFLGPYPLSGLRAFWRQEAERKNRDMFRAHGGRADEKHRSAHHDDAGRGIHDASGSGPPVKAEGETQRAVNENIREVKMMIARSET